MNKILFFYVFFSSLLFANNINEHKIDLFFGNGIDTSFKDAKIVTKKINETLFGRNLALRDTFFYKNVNNDYKFNINLAYNNTFGFFNDLFEAGMQKDFTLGCYLTSNDSLVEKIKLSEISQEVKDQLLLSIVNGETNCNVMKGIEEYDITTQLNDYRKSLNAGHRVMAVVHSQGNLFLNEVGKKLESWEKNYIEAYGIASPANEIFKNNNEFSLNNYITLNEDPIILTLGLTPNYGLTYKEKADYNIYGAAGHYIDNYLRVPSTRDIIIEGIEGKSKKLLNLPSLFKFIESDNYCNFLTISHKFKNESYQGLIFNEEGKVNSIGNNIIINNNYLESIKELENDPINCYSDSKYIDFIKRNNNEMNLNLSISNISNQGYIISGEMTNYESNKTYKGEIINQDKKEIIESIKFKKLEGNSFEVSFPMITNGYFYFKLKTIDKISNEIFLNIAPIILSDNIIVTTKINSILINNFYDSKAILYNIKIKERDTDTLVEEFNFESIEQDKQILKNVTKKGFYSIELTKMNEIGETVIITKYIEVLYDNPEDYFFKKVEITNPERDFYQNTFYGYLNVEAQNLETGMKIYATKEGGLKEALAGSIVKKQLGYSFKNGHIFKYEVTIEDIDKKIVARKYVEKMIDEDLMFYYTPTVLLLENCKDIDNSGFRINNGNALNENLYIVKANGQTLLESIDLKDIFGVNLSELNTVDIILKNTITGKEFPFSVNISFTAENTICRSTLREMRQAVAYTIEKDSTGKIIKVGYTTTYQPGEGVPGKIEFFLNGELKTTYAGDQVKELINTPAKEIFPVDSSKQVKITMKVYDMYGINIIKIYDKYFVY